MDFDEDLYVVLEIERSATSEAIKRAYFGLAKKHHPDQNKGHPTSEARFKRIAAAYQVLIDAEKRQLYDEFGFDGLKRDFDPVAGRAARQADRERAQRASEEAAARDAVQSAYASGVVVQVWVNASALATGTETEVWTWKHSPCGMCGGARQVAVYCSACFGTGHVMAPMPTACFSCGGIGVWPPTPMACGFCGGDGTPCYWCHGSGVVQPGPCLACGGNGSVVVAMAAPCPQCAGNQLIPVPCAFCQGEGIVIQSCLLYTSPSPRD